MIDQVVDPMLAEAAAGVEADAGALSDAMFEAATELADEIDQQFERQHQRLETVSGRLVRGRIHRLHRAPLTIARGDPFAAAKEAASGAVRSQNLRVGVGMAAGVTIGTAIFPGVGSVLGGIVGALAGGLAVQDADDVRGRSSASSAPVSIACSPRLTPG